MGGMDAVLKREVSAYDFLKDVEYTLCVFTGLFFRSYIYCAIRLGIF